MLEQKDGATKPGKDAWHWGMKQILADLDTCKRLWKKRYGGEELKHKK
jgi:hypothetical protein